MRASIVLLMLLAACTRGLGETAETLRALPTPSATPSPAGVAPGATVGSILISAPLPDDGVRSPVVVTGTARTSDGAVLVRVLDAAGMELAATAADLDCGPACRGSFRAPIAFFVERRQPGVVQVAEVDPDGTVLQLSEVRVTLVPGM